MSWDWSSLLISLLQRKQISIFPKVILLQEQHCFVSCLYSVSIFVVHNKWFFCGLANAFGFPFNSNSCHRCYIAGNTVTASAGVDGEVMVKTGMNDEYHSWCNSIFSICCGNLSIFPRSYLFSLFNLSLCIFFPLLIIFSHFLHPVGAVKWPIVKEQTVCVWDISCWFSGTLAWWMARQKTLNNSWFASRETCSLRLNNVQHSSFMFCI